MCTKYKTNWSNLCVCKQREAFSVRDVTVSTESREGNQYSANYNFTVRSSTISPGWSDDTLTGCIQFVPAASLNLIKRLIEAQWVAAISELLMNTLLESHESDWRVQPSLWFSSTERHTLPIDRFHISWGKTHSTPLTQLNSTFEYMYKRARICVGYMAANIIWPNNYRLCSKIF